MVVRLDLEDQHTEPRSEDHEISLSLVAAHMARNVHRMEDDPILGGGFPPKALEDLDLSPDWLLPLHLEIEDPRRDHPSH
jgi:hypothetical protein